MPKITRKTGARKNRRTTTPNVFAQTQPTRPSRDDSESEVEDVAESPVGETRVRARVARTSRIAGARSEIFTRSLPAELKKLGTLAGVIVVALIVLTFTI